MKPLSSRIRIPLAFTFFVGLVLPLSGSPSVAVTTSVPALLSQATGAAVSRLKPKESASASPSLAAAARPSRPSESSPPETAAPKPTAGKATQPKAPKSPVARATHVVPAKHPGADTMVPGVPYFGQVYTEDCETAALQMALAHEGIDVSQHKLLETEGLSLDPPVVNPQGEVVRWGDPYISFVGEPNSPSISTYYTAGDGYGTYAPNIARVARRFGGEVLWFGVGLTRSRLTKAIRAGHPVIAWVGDRAGHMRYAQLAHWTAPDGRRVPYPAPSSGVYEHTVLVVGITPLGPYVNDPLNGARNGANINPVVGPGVVPWQEFLAGLATFHGMAVIMQ